MYLSIYVSTMTYVHNMYNYVYTYNCICLCVKMYTIVYMYIYIYINQFGEFLICRTPMKPHLQSLDCSRFKGACHGLSEGRNSHSCVALCPITLWLGLTTGFGLGDHSVQSRGVKSRIHHPTYHSDPGTLQFLLQFSDLHFKVTSPFRGVASVVDCVPCSVKKDSGDPAAPGD